MKVTQEPDRVNQKVILVVAAAASAATVVGVLIAWGLLEWNIGGLSTSVRPVSARGSSVPEEVNATEMTLFDSLDGRSGRRESPKRLESYGFVDREKGQVHVPIRRAMQLYIERQNSASDPHPPRNQLPNGDQR